MPNYFLTIKRLRVEQTQHRQSSTVKRGGTKLRRAINLTRLCAASNGKKMTMKITKIIIILKENSSRGACRSLARLLLDIHSFTCIVAEKPGSEVTTGIWLSTGGGWILLSAGIMKLYFRTIRCFLGFLSLFRVSLLLPSLPPRIIPAQIRVRWEYGMNTFYLLSFFFFFLSNSKLRSYKARLFSFLCRVSQQQLATKSALW